MTINILILLNTQVGRVINLMYCFMDAIHYKIKEEGRIVNRAAYVVLGVTLDGEKDILSINIEANETSKFWLGMLNDLKKNRFIRLLMKNWH